MRILPMLLTVRRSNRPQAALVMGAILGLGALMLGIGGCGGGSSSRPAASPSYTLGASALNPASVTAGNSSASTITLTPANGYSGSVKLSCGAVSGGMTAPTCAFNPATVTIGGSNAGTSTLTLSSSGSTPAGTYSVSIAASDASGLASSNGAAAVTLTVTNSPGYSLTATALSPVSIVAGSASTSIVTVTPANGYSGNVSLACAPVGGETLAPVCSFSPATVLVSGSNAGTSTLTVSTSFGTPGGRYAITVIASDANQLAPGNGAQALALAVTVLPGYSLSSTMLNPGSIVAGNAATSTITLTPGPGYAGSVSLSCGPVSGGMQAPTCSFSPATVPVSGSHAGISTLTVSTSIGTPGGSYAITVTASDASQLAPNYGAQVLTLTTAAVIQHVVIIFQENRSTDNLFHDPVLIARGADIASSATNSLGQTVPLTPINLGTQGSDPSSYDLAHFHGAFVAMYDGGKMDGLNPACAPVASCPPNFQYRYVKESDVQPYFTMAEQYTFADRMFQTNQGPSFPAHQFILSGTSAPSENSPLFGADNPTLSTTKPVGCIAPSASRIDLIDASGSLTTHTPIYPCFEHATLTDLLDARGLSWRYYSPIAPGALWTAPNAINHICQAFTVNDVLTCTGPIYTSNVIVPQTQILTDIMNGQLAKVSWVIPSGISSDHSNSSDGSGPAWVASVVNAIGNSAYWANTAIFITWDDWGGWYDHVAPKVINDSVSWGSGYVYGFRVPLIVVSPYAKAAHISHVTHDFGSILKFIETAFTLPSLGYADEPADDLSDCFNLTQTPITFQTIQAPLNADFFLHDKRPATAPDDD
jgi:phospholipase C